MHQRAHHRYQFLDHGGTIEHVELADANRVSVPEERERVLEGCVEELAYVLGGGLVAVEDHYYARYRELACQEQIVCKKVSGGI